MRYYLISAALLGFGLVAVVSLAFIREPTGNMQSVAPAHTSSNVPYLAQLRFGFPIGDADLQALLEGHSAMPFAAYTVVMEYTGSSRVNMPVTPAEFVISVRSNIEEVFASEVNGGMALRAKDFTARHTEKDVVADSAVWREATAIIDLNSDLFSALAKVRDGVALIYAVDVSGEQAQLERLKTHASVMEFYMVSGTGPEQLPRPYYEPPTQIAVSAASASGMAPSSKSKSIYQNLVTLAEGN